MKAINILNKKYLELLGNLTPNMTPKFGIMPSQPIVEHLIFTIEFSNGEKEVTIQILEENTVQNKHSYTQIPKRINQPCFPKTKY
jgi:hypothetical protein